MSITAGRYRWTVVALVFFATTINYIDRAVFGILAPTLQHDIGWTEMEYGYIIAAFTGAYALGLLFVGRSIDAVGTKTGFAASIVVWSLAAIGHALARSPFGFGVARAALGLGESGNFPASIKAVAEWFPKRERALATGVFNSGANIGAVVAPLVVPWITLAWGWQAAFVLTGLLGFIWLAFWLKTYDLPERHGKVSQAEVEYIQSDPVGRETGRTPWLSLLKRRQAWGFVAAKFLTDPFWWFYLYWLPKFLNDRYGLDLAHVGLPLILIYTMSSAGSVGGGWLSGFLIRRGWSINRGRKTTMLIAALLVTPIVLASYLPLWWSVLLIGLATAAHQGWSANLFTTVSDMFPKRAVGSIVGIGGLAGSVGGVLIAALVGAVLQNTGSYLSVFVLAGGAYLLTFAVYVLLVPEIEPIEVS